MNFKNLKWVALTLAMLASCGEKGNDPVIDNPEGPQGSGSMKQMSPEESKEFLQTTATEFLDLIKPGDQKAAIKLAAYFSNEFEDFDAPEEFDIEPDGQNRTPAAYIKAIGQFAKGDLDAATRAALTYSYSIYFERFAGVYEPDYRNECWVKTGNSKDIVFKFSNDAGQPVEMKVSQSGGTSDVDFSFMDWDWDYINGQYVEYEEEYKYFLSIPKNVNVTLTENGNTLANSTAITSINIDGHKISADVTTQVMNISAKALVDGNDSKVEGRAEFFVDGQKVADSYATINGKDLCNKDKYESMEDMDDEEFEKEFAKMFKNGDCGANVLDKVQAYGQLVYYQNLPQDLGAYFDDEDFSSKSEAQKACQKVCDRINEHCKTQLRYNNTATDQATLVATPYVYSWGSNYWEYYPICQLLFPDGTTYDIDNYFGRFTTVTNKFESLLSAYERLWHSVGGR